MSGKVRLVWGDGEHDFKLAIGHLRELQDKCKAGPPEILRRLSMNEWHVDDVRETIRLGLVGGGKTPSDAFVSVVRYVDERPLLESAQVAMAVLMAALVGVPDDPVGKDQPEKDQTNPTVTPAE